MIRRSFRIGLWLGLIAGVGFAAMKLFRPKPSSSSVLDLGTREAAPVAPRTAAADSWEPLEVPVATPTPVETPEPDSGPVVPAAEPGLVLIGDEPIQEPIEPEPAAAAPVPAWPSAAPEPAPEPAPSLSPVPAPEPDPDVAAFAPPPPEPASAPVVKKAAPVQKAAPRKAAAPAAKKVAPAKKVLPPWVDPKGGICPKSHPVKGKLSSMIFQIPGNFAYDRTNPDRCYQSVDVATKDGLRPAKR
jgi:hypothetical protein